MIHAQGDAMSPQEILKLAKQGHPIAIGTLLNYSTRPQGIKARVQRQGHCLHVLLEANQSLNPNTTVSFVRSSLRILNVESLQTLMVYCRQRGHRQLDWRQTIQLRPLFDSPLSRRNSVTQPPPVFPESVIPDSSLSTNSQAESSPFESDLLDDQEMNLALPETPTEQPDLLKRPESVLFLLFISLFLFWDAYLELLEDPFPSTTVLSASQLSRRLQVSKKVIRRKKRELGFGEWTRTIDPEGIAWTYHKGSYLPQG